MSASDPSPVEDIQGDGRWMSVHNRFVNHARELEPDILFVGDSIIANLQCTNLWEKWFAPMHSLNFGIGGDQTQNVLWRLQNGELEGLKPKAIVMLIGTNNYSHSADEVAEGVLAICRTIRDKQPQALLIAMEILPRGQNPNSLREKNKQVNKLVAEGLKKFEMCEIVEASPELVMSDGSIDHRDMFDYVHPTRQGYEKAFRPVHDILANLLLEQDTSILNDASTPTSDTAHAVND